MPRMRTLRDTLLDHLDENEAFIARVVEAGMALLGPRLRDLVADAAPRTATAESVMRGTAAVAAGLRVVQAGAHLTAAEHVAREKSERRDAAGPRGGPIHPDERQARRRERTKRVVVVGGPRTGKTTWALDSGLTPLHTDDLIEQDWSAASASAAQWFDAPGPWVVEGVATVRALRKWLVAHPTGLPCDEVRVLEAPHVTRTDGQEAMAKAVRTVWDEVAPELALRGVAIHEGP